MDPFYESVPYFQLLVSELTIPFSNKYKDGYVYNGTENIPFKQRDPLYQSIMVEEFITF